MGKKHRVSSVEHPWKDPHNDCLTEKTRGNLTIRNMLDSMIMHSPLYIVNHQPTRVLESAHSWVPKGHVCM